MAATDRPSARLLGVELRDYRIACGLTGAPVARTLRCSPSKISRIENARVPPGEQDLERLLRLYRVPETEYDRLRSLQRKARTEAFDQDIAGEVLAWAPDAVPLPLRTEAYARAVLRSVRRVRQVGPSEIKAQIVAARAWQDRLCGRHAEDEQPPPQLTLTCVLDEAVLARRRGPTSVMAAQLDLLGQLARLDCVELRVLPLDADGPAFGPFMLIGYGGHDEITDRVLIDGPAGTDQIIDDKTVTAYRFAHEDLVAAAADVEESAAMLKRAAATWA